MRIAVIAPDGLFRDGLIAMLTAERFVVVAAGCDYHACFQGAIERGVDAFLIDAKTLTADEVAYIEGARLYGGFCLFAISDGDSPPDGFDGSIDRSASRESLIALFRGLNIEPPIVRSQRRGRRAITHGFPLSEREYELASLIAKGYQNGQIAETMDLKEQSVKNLVSLVIRKLGCQNRVQVALRFLDTSK
ncbi:MAG TPA: response regulator transcription factor [Fimbriimonadaceae bacterium]|nr:response regulator transcription factor [Fimbriimonadaceae bacterium]